MRIVAIVLFLSWVLVAQVGSTPTHAALVRGVLLECDPHPTGEFLVRLADNQVLRFRFDPRTYVEREDRLIDAARLVAGEKVEVVSDPGAGHLLSYARTIHVIQPVPPPRPRTLGRFRAYDPKTEPAFRTGTITYSGVVFRVNSQRVVLHTREAGDMGIILRTDTRYLADGQLVSADALKPNMRVFVRAGKDLYNQVEAYQVIWGNILTPR